MSELFDVILQGMRDSFPKLNWKLGSVIRSLLVAPLTKISDQLSEHMAEVTSSLDLESLVNSPTGHDAELDAWMSRLGIALPDPVPSTGSVAVILNSPISLTIPEGAAFTWEDDVTVYAVNRTDWTESNYKKLAPGVYMAEVPVSTRGGSAVSIGSNEPINWSNAPDEVTDVYVLSPVSGGHTNNAQDKAELIRAALAAPSMFGEEAIRSAVIRRWGNIIADVKLGQRSDISATGSVVPIFIKQAALPAEQETRAASVIYGADTVQFRINTSGVVEILGVWTSNGVEIQTTQEQVGELGTPGSYCVFTAARPPVDLVYYVRTIKYTDAVSVVEWLNSTQNGLPFKMYAKLPVLCSVYLNINTGGETVTTEAKAALCSYINQAPLDATLSDTDIKAILTSYGYSVNSAILYVGFLHTPEGARPSMAQTGSFVCTGQHTNAPAALYCSVEHIATY